jgi:hypothetical protein
MFPWNLWNREIRIRSLGFPTSAMDTWINPKLGRDQATLEWKRAADGTYIDRQRLHKEQVE